jgi:hypothetical protein
LILLENNGAGVRSRTADLMITNQLLYQLSYTGILSCSEAITIENTTKSNSFLQAKERGKAKI